MALTRPPMTAPISPARASSFFSGASRYPAGGHIRSALGLLMDLLELSETLQGKDRLDVRAALHRLWLALREIQRDGLSG